MKISILSVLALCTLQWASAQSGAVSGVTDPTVNEAEAHITINPSDTNQMAVGYMEGTSGGLQFAIYYSTDAGDSWTRSTFDASSMCSPIYPGALLAGGGDIILAYDQTGKLYASWIYLYYDINTDSAYFSGFWASSLDSGQSFQFENPGTEDIYYGRGILYNGFSNVLNDYQGVCDRQWMAVDHSSGSAANTLYVGYVNFTNTFSGMRIRAKHPDSTGFASQQTAVTGDYQFTNIAVDQNGVVHYTCAQLSHPFDLWHISSTDGGMTFSSPHRVGPLSNPFPQSNFYVNDRENAAPSLAIDGSGNLHVAWTDFPGSGAAPTAFYARSTDGGLTWSAPLDLSAILSQGTFFANVTAWGDKVSISTYDIDTNKQADYYLLLSTDNGLNFGAPIKLTNQQSDFASFPMSDFAGDYTSSARTDCRTFSVWSDFRNSGQPKLYLSKYTDCYPDGYQELSTINSPFQITALYPNPAQETLSIQIESIENVEVDVTIYDLLGKQISLQSLIIQSGTNTTKLSTRNYAAGQYILSLTDDKGNKITRQISKM